MNTQDKMEDKADSFDGDKLDQIFAGQAGLMGRYKKIAEGHFTKVFRTPIKISDDAWKGQTANLHTKEGNFLIKDMIDSTIQELSEATQTMKNWKSWKQTEMPTDTEHWKEEMVDALHFFVEALLLAGVSSDELHQLYFKKHAVNEFRQKSKY